MAYLHYNCEGYLGGNKEERERERMKGMGKMPIEKGKSNDGRKGTQISIIPWGVLPSAGGANEEGDFHSCFFLSIFSFHWDLFKLPIGYSCF